jgi:multiple sugar transport system substrate-binding protein
LPRTTVDLTIIPTYSEYLDKIVAVVLSGQPLDIVEVNVLAVFPLLYLAGALADLTPYVQRAKRRLDDYWPSQMKGFMRDGKVWAFGRDFSPRTFYVNRTMLARAGQSLDDRRWSWDDLVRVARAMTQGEGTTKQWGTAVGEYYTWLYAAGGRVYNAEGTRVMMDTPQAIQAIEFMAGLVVQHRVAPRREERGDRSERQLFIEGRLGMAMDPRGSYPAYNQITGFEWDVVLPPAGPAGAWTAGGGAGYALLKSSKHLDTAWEVLAWATGEGQKEVADVLGIPAYKPATQSPKFSVTRPANDRVWLQIAEKHTRLHPQHPKHREVDRLITTELQKALQGEESAREVGQRIADQGTALIQGVPWPAPE